MRQQQALLEEMAGQPGVRWFAVTDAQGNIILIIATRIRSGEQLYSPHEMQQLKPEMKSVGGGSIAQTELACTGSLSLVPANVSAWRHGMHRMRAVCSSCATRAQQAIFIAFDASELWCNQSREKSNTLIILFALATVLLASVLSFFWYRRYLRSRQLSTR